MIELNLLKVNNILTNHGLNLAIDNPGLKNKIATSFEQSPSPGSTLIKGDIVTVSFAINDDSG